jgi:hypothetical protein
MSERTWSREQSWYHERIDLDGTAAPLRATIRRNAHDEQSWCARLSWVQQGIGHEHFRADAMSMLSAARKIVGGDKQ